MAKSPAKTALFRANADNPAEAAGGYAKKIFIKEIQILKNINLIQFQVMCFQMPEKNFQQKR